MTNLVMNFMSHDEFVLINNALKGKRNQKFKDLNSLSKISVYL